MKQETLFSSREKLEKHLLVARMKDICSSLSLLPEDERVEMLNDFRVMLHSISPFSGEPVDCVLWVKSDFIEANDYNPNSVAPPEMKLLEHSIQEDGYTQPIVSWPKDGGRYEVVDGFHRNRVGRESKTVSQRVRGYLPVTVINPDRQERNDRIASTIRHNRARGKHRVEAMSDIVVELKRRNWTNERIGRELGMDQDEVLRLCQITGLAELFSDQEFSRAWDVEGSIEESDFMELTDDPESFESETLRKVHTGGDNRIFHTYEKWECYKAGFYNTTMPGMTKEECERAYRDFLSDSERFSSALDGVLRDWPNSCEHYLTNESMNRIAWLGQAAVCYEMGIPSVFRGGFGLLSESQQETANTVALKHLNRWLSLHDRDEVTMEAAYSGRQADIY